GADRHSLEESDAPTARVRERDHARHREVRQHHRGTRAPDRVRRLAVVAPPPDHTTGIPTPRAGGRGSSLVSAKQLRLIILTLAVVLLLWGASERFSRGSDTVTGGFSLPAPARAHADTISLVKGQDSIVLAKQSATVWSENGSAYVRRPGDSHVFLCRGRLASLADRAADEWRDKRIAVVTPDSVVLVDVERGKDRYTLRRAGKAWTLDRAAADPGAVARL